VSKEPLPPPLPPETRTVGQLVAESLRLYGRQFWLVLPLGVPLAVADSIAVRGTVAERILVLIAATPAFTAAYVWASALVGDVRPPRVIWIRTIVIGSVVFLPAAFFFPWFAVLSVAWLALVGLVVPVLVIERTPVLASLRRAVGLARADYVHALGSLATLVIVFVLTRVVLGFLLREQADNAVRVATFLADVVISPLLFMGAALLYVDQAARARVRSASST
jgi:hypothetical protein